MANGGSNNALQSASDTTKQILTLCTAVLTFTVTFAKEFKGAAQTLPTPGSLRLCWLTLTIAIFFGVWTLMAITGTQQKPTSGNAMGANIRIPAALMVISFAVGILCLALAGWNAPDSVPKAP